MNESHNEMHSFSAETADNSFQEAPGGGNLDLNSNASTGTNTDEGCYLCTA